MTDLKPCPFCGNEVKIQSSSRSSTFIVYHTKLRNCPFYKFEIPWEFAKSLREARELWNRRKSEKEVQNESSRND